MGGRLVYWIFGCCAKHYFGVMGPPSGWTQYLYVIYVVFVFVLLSSEGSADGSPCEPSLCPLTWSVTGKYLASATDKLVNIWQVNGKQLSVLDHILNSFICS